MSKAAKSIAFLINTATTSGTRTWLRVKKSTEFTLSYNAETEDFDYIADESKTTEIQSYAPSLDQDISILPGEADYEWFNTFRKLRAVGADAHKEFAVVYINDGDNTDGFYTEVQEAVVSITDYSATDGKINVNIAFCGNVIKGTTTVANGVYTFAEEE